MRTLSSEELPQRAERSSTEIVFSLFGPSVGLCWGDFSCSHHRQRGRLYASSNAIAFFSNLFGFEQRLCLQLADVVKIKAFRTTSVRITTREGEQYIFKSLSDRELVVALLLQLKQKTRSENEPMLTDSTLSQSDADNSRLDVSLEDPPSEQHASEKVMEQSSSALEPSSVEKEMEIEASSDADSVQSDRCVVTPYVDPQDAWDKAKNGNDPPYSETALEELLLTCTLDEFFALFLADNAPHSIEAYQQSVIGDSKLDVSAWSTTDDGFLERIIQFCHPLALGVGPSSAHAERRQRFRRFGEYGFCLETATYVKGVIASDCFYVDDKWIVEPCGETNVTLTVKHQVRFTKRTMLKRIIAKSTNTEVESWFAGYSKMLLASLEGKGSKDTDLESKKDQLEAHTELSQTAGCFPSATFLAIMWACLMAGVVLLLLQGASTNVKLKFLEKELVRLRQDNMKAFAQLEEAIVVLKMR